MTSRIWWTLEIRPGSSGQWQWGQETFKCIKDGADDRVWGYFFVGPWLRPTWMRRVAALTPSSTSSSPRRNTTRRQTTPPKRFSIHRPCRSVFEPTLVASAWRVILALFDPDGLWRYDWQWWGFHNQKSGHFTLSPDECGGFICRLLRFILLLFSFSFYCFLFCCRSVRSAWWIWLAARELTQLEPKEPDWKWAWKTDFTFNLHL